MKQYKLFSLYAIIFILFISILLYIMNSKYYVYIGLIPISVFISLSFFHFFHRVNRYDKKIEIESYTILYHSDRHNIFSSEIEMNIMSYFDLEICQTNYPFSYILYFNNLTEIKTFLKDINNINDIYYKCFEKDNDFINQLDWYIARDIIYKKYKTVIKNKIRADKIKNVVLD